MHKVWCIVREERLSQDERKDGSGCVHGPLDLLCVLRLKWLSWASPAKANRGNRLLEKWAVTAVCLCTAALPVFTNDRQWTRRSSQEAQNNCITFVQRRTSVFDAGPTLYKCYTNVLCLPGFQLEIPRTSPLNADQSGIELISGPPASLSCIVSWQTWLLRTPRDQSVNPWRCVTSLIWPYRGRATW